MFTRSHDNEENVDHRQDSQILTGGVLHEFLTEQDAQAESIANDAPDQKRRIEDSHEKEAKIQNEGQWRLVGLILRARGKAIEDAAGAVVHDRIECEY